MSESFGSWELLSRLGHNELAQTDLAQHRENQRKAVLKRISPDVRADPAFYEALKAEVGLAAQLVHPSAAAVLEVGEAEGAAFVAMEYVDGVTLAQLMRAAQATGAWPLSMDRAVCLMGPVLEALAAAHALSPPLLHRDLVPQNVLVTAQGRVVLADFGLGRARLRAGGGAGLRRAYVSPEQARGTATDARSEVFVAGLVLFELVCGRLPAQGAGGEVIARIATGELDAPLAVNPRLDDAAIAVLARALAHRPEERFASAHDFFAALALWRPTREAPLAAWVTQLSAVKLEAPAPQPTPHEAPLSVSAPPAPDAKRSPVRSRRKVWVWASLAAAAGLIVASQVVDLKQLTGAVAVDSLPAGRPFELSTIPTGAQVFVDGVLEQRRTPLTFSIPKDEFRNIIVKKPGVGSWTGIVYNSRRLEVVLATGGITEDRYEGQRPVAKEPVKETTAVDPQPQNPAPREVVFDAESPPLEVVLTRAHSVRGDTPPGIPLEAGDKLSLTDRATLFIQPPQPSMGRNALRAGSMNFPKLNPSPPWPSHSMGTFRLLNLFALRSADGVVEVLDLSKPVTLARAGTWHLFSPTESGELSTESASVTVNGEAVPLKPENLMRVEPDDSFLIRVLQPLTTYRLELTRADGKKGPLPVVVMALRPDQDPTQYGEDFDSPLRFDNQPLPSGQALVGAGAHTIYGARNAWFTIITAKDIEPVEVKLTIRVASGKKPPRR